MNNAVRKLVAQNVLRTTRRNGSEVTFKRPTMDDMPVPQGSWKDDYQRKQAKYNRHLILGTLVFIGTTAVAYQSIDYNFYTPMYPAGHPKADM